MYKSKLYKGADLGGVLNIADKLGMQYKAVDNYFIKNQFNSDDIVRLSISLMNKGPKDLVWQNVMEDILKSL